MADGARDDSELYLGFDRVTGPLGPLGLTLNERLHERGFSLERIDEDGESKLALRDLNDSAISPLAVDFTSPGLLYRMKSISKNQPLGRAIGARDAPFVIDATAGLGTDALVMAALGCRVRSFERNDIVFALLQDGHARLALKNLDLSSRLSFEHADARAVFAQIAVASVQEEAPLANSSPFLGVVRPDVVYLDPMYPEEGRSKSALPKKTMQMFRRLLDGDFDSEELFAAAMKVALKRVVVKRPLKAPALGSRKPSHTFEGKTARYDLYLVI